MSADNPSAVRSTVKNELVEVGEENERISDSLVTFMTQDEGQWNRSGNAFQTLNTSTAPSAWS